MNKALYARAQELGVKVLLETPAKKIIMKDGKVAGVLAVDKDGKDIEITCKAAIVCTGGAGCNKKFIEDETGISMEKICLILLFQALWERDFAWHGRLVQTCAGEN